MIKNIIEKIRIFLQEEIALESVKTTDGTILSFESLEVGMEIFVIAEDGTETPAPDASYTFEDGTIVDVVGGKIDKITPVEPVEGTPETEVETPEVEVEVEVPMAKLCKEDLERLEKLEAENITMKEMITQLAETLSKMNFKEDLKMSNVETPKVKIEQTPMVGKNVQLNSIFKNMYK